MTCHEYFHIKRKIIVFLFIKEAPRQIGHKILKHILTQQNANSFHFSHLIVELKEKIQTGGVFLIFLSPKDLHYIKQACYYLVWTTYCC